MTRREAHSWVIVAVLIVSLIEIWGSSIGAVAAFFPPLVKEFGWSSARVSSLASIVSVGIACGYPIAGWALEKIGARIPMAIGAALTGGGLLLASRIHSFEMIAIAYVIAGFGCGLATTVPAAVVVANWFDRNRGLAMGLAMIGASAGGMIMIQVASLVTGAHGWRAAYVAMGLPIFVLIIPLIIIVVRLRPPEKRGAAAQTAAAKANEGLPGLSLRDSIGTRSFWMLAILAIFWTFSILPPVVELMIYLMGIGYSREISALALSVTFGFTAIGKTVFGVLADRIGAKMSQFIAFVMVAVGCVFLVYSREPVMLWLFLPIFGLAWGSPLALYPLLTIYSLGMKYYPSIFGVLNTITVVGSVSGPIVIGMLVDMTKSYAPGFALCGVAAVIAAVMTLACKPEFEDTAQAKPAAALSKA